MLLDRRTLLAGTAAALAAAPALAQRRRAGGDWYDRAIIIDGLGGSGDPKAPPGIERITEGTWAEIVATGVTVVRDSVLPVGNVADPWADYQKQLAGKQAMLGANPDRLLLIRTAADILRAKREKKFGILLGTQDTVMIGPELDRLAQLKKDGVMTIQLTYNNANLAGDGAIEPRNSGLTKLGKATIERIEAEKLLLDLSHGGAKTMAEAAAFAKRPLVVSHTGARALNDHPRNIDDGVITAVAGKGGVVGVYFMPFLRTGSPATTEDVIAHIDHVARVAGEDHVGIGTDNGVLPNILDAQQKKALDDWQRERIARGIAAPGEGIGIYPWVDQLNSLDRYRRLAGLLQRRGWSQSRVEKLFGGNFLRVYREAWGG